MHYITPTVLYTKMDTHCGKPTTIVSQGKLTTAVISVPWHNSKVCNKVPAGSTNTFGDTQIPCQHKCKICWGRLLCHNELYQFDHYDTSSLWRTDRQTYAIAYTEIIQHQACNKITRRKHWVHIRYQTAKTNDHHNVISQLKCSMLL